MKHSLQRWLLLLLSFGLALGARGQSPTLATIETSNALYTGQPVQLTNTLTVSSGTSLTGATVSISSGFQSATDQLLFINQSGITGSYNSATGVLTLSGSATFTTYRIALRSITYSASGTPTPSPRQVQFTVANGTGNSNTQGRTVAFVPTVATAAPSSVGSASAVLGGNVTADGGDLVTERGVVYSLSSANATPTIGGAGVTTAANGAGTGTFSATISGLTNNAAYSVRAYATNGAGTTYGGVQTFTPRPVPFISQIAPASSPVGSSVVITGTGFALGATVAFNGTAATSVTVNSATQITAQVPVGATSGNVVVTTAGGSSNGFAFTVAVAPAVATATPSSVGSTSAVLGGNVTANGGATVTARGIVYSSTNSNPTVGGTGTTTALSGTGTGAFSGTVSGLAVGTTYSVAAYATNSAGTSYGSVASFTTVPSAPVVLAPANGGTVGTTTPSYPGTAQANSTITVYVDGAALGTTMANASGNWSFTQPTALSQGSHTVRATAAINGSAQSADSNTNTFTVDTARPTVTISSSAGSSGGSTGTTPIPFTVTFSESVTGFVQGDLAVVGGAVLGFTGSGSTYTFSVTPGSSGTTVTVNVAANVAQDAAFNGNTAASQFSLTYQQPVVATAQPVTVNLSANGTAILSASSVDNGSTGPGTLTYTIQKIVYGKVGETQTLTLTTPNGANFTGIRFASYGTPTDNGNGNYSLGTCNAANSVTTATNSFSTGRSTGSMDASNGFTANNNPALGDPCSNTPKSLAVQAAYSVDAASLTYDCTEASKTQYVLLTVSNGTSTSTSVAQVTVNPAPTATITSVNPSTAQPGTNVAVSGTNLSGLTSLTVNGAPATISNLTSTGFSFVVPNNATASTGNLTVTAPCSQTLSPSFTVQVPTATVASVTRLTPSPTATTQVSYQVVFSTSVSGVSVGNFSLAATGSVSGAAVASVTGSGTTYTVEVNTGTGEGTLLLNVDNNTGITPAVTNTPYTGGQPYTITRSFAAAPQLTIQAAGSASGNGDVTAFVDVVQVLRGGSAVANALANNDFESSNVSSNSFLYQQTGVVASPWSFGPQAGVARTGSGFGPTPASGDAVALLQSYGGNNGSISQNLAVPTGSYQVSFQTIQRNYTSLDQRLNVFVNDVFVGSIQPNNIPIYDTFTSAPFNVTAPALTATVSTASASPTGTSPIPFSVSFSQGVGTTFTASDVTVTGGGTPTSFSGSGAGPYIFNVTPTGTGTVTVSLAANVATDANNTGNTASNAVSVQYQQPATAAPVITSPANNTFTNQAVTISGTSPANSSIVLYLSQNGGAFQPGMPIKATAAGTFSVGPVTFPDATYQVYATAQSPGGASVSPTSATNTFTVDTSRPSVAISSTAGSSGGNTSTTPIPFTVTFSENVTGFVAGDVTVTNGAITGNVVNGSGTTYTFTVTPTTAGTATTVSVPANVAQDAAGNFNTAAPAAYALTFVAPTIVVAPASLPNGTTGVAYSQTLTASGGTAPYTYAITSGALPSGITLAAGGTLSGTPTVSGTFNFTVMATDNSAAPGPYSGARSYSLTIERPTITVAPASLPGGTVSVAYSQTLTASGGTGSYTYAITAGATPNGLSISTGGVLSGTPTVANTFSFTVTATDAFGSSGSQAYTVTIAAPAVTSVTWTGAMSTDWLTAGNWTPNTVPTATISATIPSAPSGGRFPVISTALANARNLTLNSGSTLTITGNTLVLAGNLTNNGTLAATGGTVNLGGTTLSSVVGSSRSRFWNLTVGANGAQLATSAGASVQGILTLNGPFSTNANSFTLESNVSNTAMVVNNGSNVVSGSVTVQRYIAPDLNANLGYRHVSAPISNATVGSLATGSFSPVVNPAYNASAQPGTVTPFPTVYGYDQSRLATATNNLADFDKGWYSPAALSDALAVGQGYTALLAAGQTWNFTGPQNNGNIALNLARNSGATAAASGLALVGNPYPAPLDWSLVMPAERPGVDAIMYVFASNDPSNPYAGSYRFYQGGFGTISPVLPLGQGFFVKVTQGQTAGTLNLNNGHRLTSYTSPTYHRTAETRPVVHLTLQGVSSPLSDDAFVYFEAGAADGYQAQYDGEKLANPSGLNLSSSLSATQRLCVNGLEPLGTSQKVVPLAVGVPAVGSYTLHAAEVLNLSTVPVYLRDKQTGALIDLAQQPSYQFTVSNASALITSRFELVFSPQQPLATAPAALVQQVGLYPNPATTSAYLELPASLGRQAITATLVDAVGRPVRTIALPAQGTVAHQLDLRELATGVYALRLSTSAGVVVKKLLVE